MERTLKKREVYINEIVFATREEIYLYGFINHDGVFHETQYVTNRHDLTLLLAPSKKGQELLWMIEELFVQPHQVPTTINLLDLFGMTQPFEAQSIEVDLVMIEDGKGDLVEDDKYTVLFIEKVIPYSFLSAY